jgi:flagellar motor protein MotB
MRAVPLVVALLALVAQGCCQAEKQQINDLKSSVLQLQEQNNDLKTRLARAQGNESQLLMELQEQKSQLDNKEETIADLRSRLGQSDSSDTGTAQGWERGMLGDKVSVGSDVLFASGKATLTAGGKRTLATIARQLKSTYQGLPVHVYGYTDSDPIRKTRNLWQDNLDLSANRAMAVTRYLIEQGLPADNIYTIAMGATNFVASNKTKQGKAQNRRVEIVAIKK